MDYHSPKLGLDCVVECFEGYSAYLIIVIVDEYSQYVWVLLCNSKEPPVKLVKAFFAIQCSTSVGMIRTDQGGKWHAVPLSAPQSS